MNLPRCAFANCDRYVFGRQDVCWEHMTPEQRERRREVSRARMAQAAEEREARLRAEFERPLSRDRIATAFWDEDEVTR